MFHITGSWCKSMRIGTKVQGFFCAFITRGQTVSITNLLDVYIVEFI
jgi:hypothetical protein